MPVSDIMKIGYLKYALVLLGLFAVSCSVKENLDECPPEPPVADDIRQLLYLRITDAVTRADISDTEDLDDIMVYLFDRDEKLLDTIPYTTSMIRRRIPIDLTGRDMAGGYASVWANIGNSVETSPVTMGADIDDLTQSMLANDNRADFFLCPGDMFFGYRQIAFSPIDDKSEADTVWIQRKNSKLNITVRGLTDTSNADNYYFRIGSLYSAYNFEGTPQLIARNIWEQGEFDSSKDYISPEPYIMIHNSPTHVYSETSRVLVEMFRVGGTRTDTLVVSGDRDSNGDYIKLAQGKTTNVLLALDSATDEVTVRVVITPWDEIYQWTVW